MRIAVISDIHGNIKALEAVLEDIKKREVDTIVCLGDLVGYGPFPNEVIKRIKEEDILNIIGNYDTAVVWNDIKYIQDNELNRNFALDWSVAEVSEGNKKYLKRLPDDIVIADKGKVITFVHGSNRSVNEYLKEDSNEAKEAIEELKGDILVCGHTHLPYEKRYGNKILINDGSVGKPKIGNPNSTYCILDFDENTEKVEFIEVSYDYESIAKAMEERNFPKELIDSIRNGK
ncbi:metallophosphoesterase family protein [Clostridium sp. MB40-C1]|uniref:metallophosphoesterase family protein n=1 Tax=Clostridium sp. MB40-C1 TaxID=3070996 RepID=UPI0027DF2018|nr:metallophosphoesterase family protein [Clostridium sp. MB40-C1]WMJ81409.1 metallophosphoesterase family protein [Clostridium sp. MB40-C1]